MADQQSWAPQSPDLTAYKVPNSDHDSTVKASSSTSSSWAPQSPEFSGIRYKNELEHQPPTFDSKTNNGNSAWQPPQYLHNGLDHSPFHSHNPHNSHNDPIYPQTNYTLQYNHQNQIQHTNMPIIKNEHPQQIEPPTKPGRGRKANSNPQIKLQKMDTGGIEIKTKFPTARIKRIMQADEDVGKVAQVTPIVMAKALELFMIRLIGASAEVAKARGSKRVLTAHMKAAIMKDDQFDNLREIVDKVPDAPVKKAKDSDSDEEENDAPKKRKRSNAGTSKSKKRKGSSDDDEE